MNKKNTNPSYFEKTFGKKAAENDREDGAAERKAPKEQRDFKKGPDDRQARGRKPDTGAERKPFERGERKSFEREDRKSFDRKDDRKPYERKDAGERRPFGGNEERGERKSFDRGPREDRKSFDRTEGRRENARGSERSGGFFDQKRGESRGDKPARKNVESRDKRENNEEREARPSERTRDNQVSITRDNQVKPPKIGAHLKPSKKRSIEEEDDFEDDDIVMPEKEPEKMPLNKYIAHCGVCSRRDAVELIKQGKVKVNGELATEPGMKINDGDAVSVSGKKIVPQRNLVYILLNKPKGFITTTEDDKGRRTIMDLVAGSQEQRLYPIGRLDRNTTGLIILTNDGELSQKLSHPKYNIKKVYQVTLDKAITKQDFEKILAGVELEDGVAPVDSLAMLEEKNELGIEIHSGRNRIVRRIFEHLGYQVEKLDRVMYAGLTKKNVPRGKWRLLTEREVILLKHFKS